MNEFYRFRAEAGDEPSSAELMIFSTIGEWDDMGDVSAKAFAKDLAKLPTSVKRLDIHINSPGGSVFEAQGIYSRLADHRSTKHVYVDGLAASAASIVAMVGHKIFIRANANMMIHMPSGLAMGNADDMRHMATALDSITESMINVYAKRTGLERDELRDLLAAETWFSPQDAVEKGFADEVRGVVKAAAMVDGDPKHTVINGRCFDLSRFQNLPAFTASTNKPKTMDPKPPKATTPTTGAEPEGDDTPPVTGTPPAPKPPAPAPKPQPQPPKPQPPPEPTTLTPAAETDFDKGAQAERQRVAALMELDRPATHAIVQAAIKEGKQPADIVKACFEAMDKKGTHDARHADASALNGIPPSDGGADEDNAFATRLKEKVASRLKARNPRATANSRS
jgi:ATP-dependent protease ClpP protease subunit